MNPFSLKDTTLTHSCLLLLLKLLLKPFLFFDDFKSDEGGTTSAILILVVAILLSRGERERDNNARGGSLRCFEEFRKLFFPREI
jgi:hypothetical protein